MWFIIEGAKTLVCSSLDGHKDLEWFRPSESKTLRPLESCCCVYGAVQG
jgi:hypothetical protein